MQEQSCIQGLQASTKGRVLEGLERCREASFGAPEPQNQTEISSFYLHDRYPMLD
jgi:hypothetical protein